MDSLVQSFHPWLQANDVTSSFSKGTGAVTLPISIKSHKAWVRFFPGWCLVGGGKRLDSWCFNFPNVSQFFRCETCQCVQVSGEGRERVVSPMLKCKLWMRAGSLPVPWLICYLVLEMSLDHSELHSLWCNSGHGDSVPPAVSPRLCWSWCHKAGQLWSSKSSGRGYALPPSEFLPSTPRADAKGRTQTTGKQAEPSQTLPDSVKGQRKRVEREDRPPRVMAMGSYFCRKEDNQPCWTQTSLNTDLEEERGILQAQKWGTSMPGRETAGDGAPAGRVGWGPAQGAPLGTEWEGREGGGVQTGFRGCWDPQAWEISLDFILRAVEIHSRVSGWRWCESVNEWIWMNEWSPWKNFL